MVIASTSRQTVLRRIVPHLFNKMNELGDIVITFELDLQQIFLVLWLHNIPRYDIGKLSTVLALPLLI